MALLPGQASESSSWGRVEGMALSATENMCLYEKPMYIHTYIYTYVHTNKYTCMYLYAYMCTHICVCVCINIFNSLLLPSQQFYLSDHGGLGGM